MLGVECLGGFRVQDFAAQGRGEESKDQCFGLRISASIRP